MRYILILSAILLLLLPVYAQESTIAALVADNPELSQFASLLERAEPSLLEQLNNPDAEFTLFAPTNAAFEALADALSQEDAWQREYLGVNSFDDLLANEDLVNEMLSLHILDNLLIWEDLLAELHNHFGRVDYLALNGYPLIFSASMYARGDIVLEEGIFLYSEVEIDQSNTDIEASNGRIYLLNGVLLPEQLTIMAYMNAVAADEEYPEYTRLVALINAADPAILDLLSDPDTEITLFTPYDIAFDELDNFEEILGDSDEATAFLSRYILPEAIYSFQFLPLLEESVIEYETISGELLSLSPADGARSGEFNVNDSIIFYPNFAMRNGVMHEMESLIPPASD
jgi:transforming growth factor-beta-induced protein